MAEALTFENVESVTPTVNQSNVITNNNLSFEGVESFSDTDNQLKQTEKPQLSFEGLEDDKGRTIPVQSDISNLEKLEYGFDKETMVVGNMFRIGKAYFQDLFDKDKTFKDYILENEKKRIEKLNEEHWKFRSGKNDSDGLVLAGEIASVLIDPYYLFGYANPFSLKALSNPISSATLNALLIGGDVAINDLAKTGEIDWNNVGLNAATAGAIGAVLPVGGKIIKKYAPKMLETEINLVKNFIDDKLAKTNNLSNNQLQKIKNAANDTEVKKLSNQMIEWNRSFVNPIVNETKRFKAVEKTLLEQRNKLITERGLLKDIIKGQEKKFEFKVGKQDSVIKTTRSKIKDISKSVVNIRKDIIKAKKESEVIKKKLIETQQKKLEKWGELVAKRNVKILENLQKNETKIDYAARALLSVAVRPLVGGGMGTVGGILFGDDETDLMYWFAAGAMAGQMQKMIQKSSKFGTKLDKGRILGIIDREWTQLQLQKIRDWTSGTSATKLASYGGATEQVGKMLFREVDSSVSGRSVTSVADQLQRFYFRKADNLVQGFTDAEIALAVSINRGKEITKDTPQRVVQLAKDFKQYIDEFKNLSENAGFFPKKEVENYFPRVLNWDVINKSQATKDEFIKTIKEIYESLGYTGVIKSGKKKGQSRSQVLAENYYNGHKVGQDSVVNFNSLSKLFADKNKAIAKQVGVSKEGDKFVVTPVTEHLTHQRSLQGPYKLVEEVLEKKGYLVNDARYIFTKLTNDSVKSIAFARQFGTNGELLQPFFKSIRDKYLNSGLDESKALSAATNEMKLVVDSIDAYFDRYGTAMTGAAKSTAAILATLGNLNMLGRVTISSLGDIIQPFQNSAYWRSALDGLRKTAVRAKNETGPAKALNLDIDNAIAQALQRSAGFEGRNLLLNNSWVGKNPTEKVNNIMFKALGLEWLTGYARRFAYNSGVADAYYLSKTISNLTKRNAQDSRKYKQALFFLQRNYNINLAQALQIGSSRNLDDAIANIANKRNLNKAGINTANRDALIPQVDNRLLFTQSNNQWVRLMGQFLSWAMAKSAQTNKILTRIEDGNLKTLVKTLAVIPIYSGVQSLREIAKYGEVVTDYDANNNRWWAEGARLSGMFGYLPELVANRFIGPGSREAWFLFPPAAQIAQAPVKAGQALWDGNTDKALRIVNERIAPLPNWRRWMMKLFRENFGEPKQGNVGSTMGGELKFSLGGAVAKAVSKAVIKRGNTAITTTKGTYTKTNKIFDDFNIERVHDFGSGKGVGSKEFKNKIVTSHEPFVEPEKIIQAKGKLPDYKTADEVILKDGLKSKDGIVNFNVLNVIENPSERIKVVDQIGKLLSDDGIAIITTRGDDVINQAKKSKNATRYLDGWLFGSKDKTFQKGFKQSELEDFVQKVLGKNFKVEKIPSKYGIGTSGVLISRIKESIQRQKFNQGDVVEAEAMKEVYPLPKPKITEESQLSDSMKVDTTTGEGANINIIKEEKPDINQQVEKVTKKDYSNVSELEPNKKAWLLNTAEKVYKVNKDNIIPNDIILAINSEETGWGTSRFVKDGSNNLFNIQVFDKNEPHIKATGSNAMIKKYPTEEDSIKDFLNMVANSEKYQGVRDTITAFNNGEASKADIIKAIANTGYAENKNWSSNVTGILNRRIDGKNREELKSVYNNLFVDKE